MRRRRTGPLWEVDLLVVFNEKETFYSSMKRRPYGLWSNSRSIIASVQFGKWVLANWLRVSRSELVLMTSFRFILPMDFLPSFESIWYSLKGSCSVIDVLYRLSEADSWLAHNIFFGSYLIVENEMADELYLEVRFPVDWPKRFINYKKPIMSPVPDRWPGDGRWKPRANWTIIVCSLKSIHLEVAHIWPQIVRMRKMNSYYAHVPEYQKRQECFSFAGI